MYTARIAVQSPAGNFLIPPGNQFKVIVLTRDNEGCSGILEGVFAEHVL